MNIISAQFIPMASYHRSQLYLENNDRTFQICVSDFIRVRNVLDDLLNNTRDSLYQVHGITILEYYRTAGRHPFMFIVKPKV